MNRNQRRALNRLVNNYEMKRPGEAPIQCQAAIKELRRALDRLVHDPLERHLTVAYLNLEIIAECSMRHAQDQLVQRLVSNTSLLYAASRMRQQCLTYRLALSLGCFGSGGKPDGSCP
jgi:hypothetical protein